MSENEYAKEISRIPLLSDEETKDLMKAMKNGDDTAREKLIVHNMRMVLKIANRYQKTINLPIEDLINIGVFGLIDAIEKFDISRNFKLSTLAYLSIENTYRKHIYLSKMNKRDNSRDVSLQDQVYEGEDGKGKTYEELIEDDNFSVDDTAIQNNRDEKIEKILKCLTKEEREILYLRHGILDGINRTLEEVGEQKSLTREGIRQKEAKALRKLRHPKITRQIKEFFEE